MWKYRSAKDLNTVLKNLQNDTIDRFPISLDVLSVLSDMSIKDVELELMRLGGQIKSYGGEVKFLESIELAPNITEFIPNAIRTRDDVLALLNYVPETGEKVEVSRTCAHVTFCGNPNCDDEHYEPDRRPITDMSLGFCSYLNLCRKVNCKYLHFKSDVESEEPVPPFCQYISADIRRLDLSLFHSLVGAVVLDPPWDIHMELSYGTMTDAEMRCLNVGSIHDEGFIFIWATVRTLDVARDCIRSWGYEYVDEVVWVKTNQIGGTVRSGRTGHWLNHNKEHCLIGMKGDLHASSFGYYRKDCDVIVAPVRETSRKPDELYSLVERIVGDSGKYFLELFGRKHNLRNGWITVGNQLDGELVTDTVLADRLGARINR